MEVEKNDSSDGHLPGHPDERSLLQLVRSAMEYMTDPVVVTDASIEPPGPKIVYANPAFCRLTGYTLGELLGGNPRMLQGPKTDRAVLDHFRKCLESETPFHGQTYNYRKDGTPYLISWTVSPMRDKRGRVTHWVSIQRDVTEEVRLQREVLEAGARERRRIGHDLHDSLGQQLTGIAFMCKVLEGDLRARELPEADTAGRVRALVEEAVEQTRTLAHGLSPLHDEPESLHTSLHELADGTTRLYHVSCSCITDDGILIEDPAVADQLYRIATEAVANAVKHASPSHIVVRLSRAGNQLSLVVEDDGTGIPAGRRSGGMGLRTMTYRAESIGGSLRVERNRPRGTRVTCSVSLAD